MNTTHDPAENSPDADTRDDAVAALEAADPGDAPDIAERLAAELAADLEAVEPHQLRPEQLDAGFDAAGEEEG